MSRIPLLPRWVLPSVSSIYDLESATISEMVPKLYGTMRDLVNNYNEFAEELNESIRSFTGSTSEEIENFKKSIEERLRCKFEDLDAKYAELKVQTSKDYASFTAATDAKYEQYKAELWEYANQLVHDLYDQYIGDHASRIISEKIAAGEINITLVYDPETEALNMTTEE